MRFMAEVGNDVSFLDIACLLKITPDMTEEKFGGAINASYFDAANLVGTLKQKGLLDIQAGFPGPTSIALTDAAKGLLNDINVRSSEPLDALDSEILRQPQPQAQQAEEIQQLQKDLAKPKPKTKIINIAVLLIAVLVVLFVLFARHII